MFQFIQQQQKKQPNHEEKKHTQKISLKIIIPIKQNKNVKYTSTQHKCLCQMIKVEQFNL